MLGSKPQQHYLFGQLDLWENSTSAANGPKPVPPQLIRRQHAMETLIGRAGSPAPGRARSTAYRRFGCTSVALEPEPIAFVACALLLRKAMTEPALDREVITRDTLRTRCLFWLAAVVTVACAPGGGDVQGVGPAGTGGDGGSSSGSVMSVGGSGTGGSPAAGGASGTAWGAPVPITEINSTFFETHSSMSDDMLRLCFVSDRPGGVGDFDIWCTQRSSLTSPFNSLKNQTALNTSDHESYAVLSADGSELYFTGRGAGDPDNIFRATWNGSEFVDPVAVAPLNTQSADRAAAPLGDELYFHSDRQGPDDDIFVATRMGGGAWGNVSVVDILNSDSLDGEPRRRGELLVFCSTRPGSGSLYGSAREAGQWTAPELLDVEGVDDGCGPSILSDGALLFHSARPGGQGADDLYIAPPL